MSGDRTNYYQQLGYSADGQRASQPPVNQPSVPQQTRDVIEVRNENNLDAQQTRLQDKGFFAGLDGALAGLDADAKTSAYAAAQEAGLKRSLAAQGLPMQEAPRIGGQNYAAHSATQLKQMVTTNMDPATVGAASGSWNSLGNTYVQIAQGLTSAAGNSEYGWQGETGDATRQFLTGMSQWAGTAGQGAQLAGNQLAAQSEAAQTVRNSVPANPAEPPSATDVTKTLLANAGDPVLGAAQLNQQYQQAQQDHAAAVQAVQSYDTSLATSGGSMPAFSTPPAFDGSSGSTGATPPGSAGGIALPSGAGSRGSRSAGGAVGQVPPPGTGSGGPGGSQPGPTVPKPPGSTTTSSYAPPATDVPVASPGPLRTPVTVPDPIFAGTLPIGSGPIGNALGSGALGGGGTGGGEFGGGEGGPGSGPGDGRAGSAAGGAAGEGKAAGGAGGAGKAAGGAGSAAGEGNAAGEGKAGESGAEGAGGMPRGGKGKGGEDTEHKRAEYLLNADPNRTFGTDEKVAPSVIGEQ